MLTLVLGSVVIGQDKPLQVVDEVDLERYAGTWYEIARLPNRFQARCTGDVTATYTLLDNGQIKVVNRCRIEEGEFIEAEGRARLADKDGPASKLKVRFAPRFLSWIPFVWGDYWIIELDPGYRYAVVGDPARKYLWILAREPEMDDQILEEILKSTGEQGYDVSNVIRTKHLPR
ncbi:lipocalin family protein [Desulfurivibrio alkaliphilus]|nr:lipocalin family protein [Desulfurivibrio alkaliphilus]